MNIIRIGTRFINLDRVIDAEICFDEAGERAIALRYVVIGGAVPAESPSGVGQKSRAGRQAAVDQPTGALLALVIKGADALALENYLNECGVVLTTAEPEPVHPCPAVNDTPIPAVMEL